MNVDLYYKLELRDRNGKLLNHPRKRHAESYVRGFLDWLYTHIAWDTAYTSPSVTGSLNLQFGYSPDGSVMGGASQSATSKGIVFGRSNTAVTISDNKMVTLITHGTGADQLIYQAVTVVTTSVSGGKRYFRMARSATNHSGSSITIEEVGGYASHGTHTFLHFRDLSTLVVADGQAASLVYEEAITV